MLACMTGPRLIDFMFSSENQINVNMNEYLNKKYTAKKSFIWYHPAFVLQRI